VAIDWLQDLDTGRRLTPFPSSYHKTGELWVNDDDMLEVLVAPYPGPEAEEQVDSADHTGKWLPFRECSLYRTLIQ